MRALAVCIPLALVSLSVGQVSNPPAPAPASPPAAAQPQAPGAQAPPAAAPQAEPPLKEASQITERAGRIVSAIRSLQDPPMDPARATDQEYLKQRREQGLLTAKDRAKLTLDLYQEAPDAAELITLMPQRWVTMEPAARHEEMARIADERTGKPLAKVAAYQRAASIGAEYQFDQDHLVPAVERYLREDPTSLQGAMLLLRAADNPKAPDAARLGLYDRIEKQWEGNRLVRIVPGKRRQITERGKPFELKFPDILTKGAEVDIATMSGKPVVVIFWAAWDSASLGQMVRVYKPLFDKYHDKGVEFIGVSLDRTADKGGRDRLLQVCSERGITWPQFYQGNFLDSEFSLSWGINVLPNVFVIAKDGTLAATDVRTPELEPMIRKMLGLPETEESAPAAEKPAPASEPASVPGH